LTKTDTPPISAPKIDLKLGWLLFITALGYGAVSTADKTGFFRQPAVGLNLDLNALALSRFV
jgi:hypothetical protein